MSRKLDLSKLKFSDTVVTTEEALKDVEPWFDNNEERYCTVKESIEQSLKEVKLMREGKLPKKTWRECREEWDKWAKEVEEELDNE